MDFGAARSFAERALAAISDFAYPRLCPLCGKASDRPGRFVCWNCASTLGPAQDKAALCRICGTEIDPRIIDGLCRDCRERKPHFDMARSATPYEDAIRTLVHDFKYRRRTWLLNDLADILEGCARASFDLREADAVVPVPLHPVKFVLRSYNQSSLLSTALAKRLGIRHIDGALRRLRDTPTQTHLGVKGRRENVSGAFAVAKPEAIRARTLLVVDDVMTTGATMDEIAKTLKAGGAWRVWALTLCRA